MKREFQVETLHVLSLSLSAPCLTHLVTLSLALYPSAYYFVSESNIPRLHAVSNLLSIALLTLEHCSLQTNLSKIFLLFFRTVETTLDVALPTIGIDVDNDPEVFFSLCSRFQHYRVS